MSPAGGVTVLATYALVVLSMWTPDSEAGFGAAAELLRYALFLGVSVLIIARAYFANGLNISLSPDWLLLIAFLSYMSLSVLWSDGAVSALIKGMLIFSAMLVSISLANVKRLDETLVIFYRCMCGFVIASIIVVFLFPDIGVETGWELEGDWRGIAGQKNGLGHISALLFVATLALPVVHRNSRQYQSRDVIVRLCMVLVSGVCLVFSGSRGALLIAGVGLGSVMLARAPRVLQRVVLIVFFAIAIPLVNLTLPTVELTADQIGVLGASINTSNRTTLWFYGLNQLSGREFLGFGVAGFWTPERVMVFKDTYGWVLDNFHNGYVTILIEGGLVGLTLLLMAIAFIVLLYLIAVGNLKDPYLSLAFGYSNMFLFSNLVENDIGRSTSTTLILFLTISFTLRNYVSYLLKSAPVRPEKSVQAPPATMLGLLRTRASANAEG